MGRGGVLLEDEGHVAAVLSHLPHPGDKGVPQGLNVAIGPQPEALREPNWRESFSSGGHSSKEHCSGRMLAPGHVTAAAAAAAVPIFGFVFVFFVFFVFFVRVVKLDISVVLRVERGVDHKGFFV